MSDAAELKLAGSTQQLQREGFLRVESAEQPICVFLDDTDGQPKAVEAYCSHMGWPLQGSRVRAGYVECAWHGARFRLSNGCSSDGYFDRLEHYRTVVVDGLVYVDPTPVEIEPA